MPLTGKPWTDKAIYIAAGLIALTLAWHTFRYFTGVPSLSDSGAGKVIERILGIEDGSSKVPDQGAGQRLLPPGDPSQGQ